MMAQRWGWSWGIVATAMMLVSCTEIERTIQNATEPCPQGSGPVSTTREFCLYVTSVQLVNQDTQAHVEITIVNRTGRRLYLVLSDPSNRVPMLTDNRGAQWLYLQSRGISNSVWQPTPLEPNGEVQASVQYSRGSAAPADVTLSLQGALSVLPTTSQGEPISTGPGIIGRGFNIAGLRPGIQGAAPSTSSTSAAVGQGAGPCPPRNGPMSTSLEFCLYVTSVQLVNQDTRAHVGITIVNRTGRRLYLVLSDPSNLPPILIDNKGAQWDVWQSRGISNSVWQPTPLEPNGEVQASVQFNRGSAAPADVILSLQGALSVLPTTSQGEPISTGPGIIGRGFNIAGLRPGLQQSAPSPAVSGKQP